ncbi:LacI family DNA-binding transcriptional regulator [Microbacterium phosphatis]|uniref:LacI family DNA-binding transcriptional regulator n=1 Tax=Microbacterium phosphatis TaxID=3140248 RepID=UPI0031409739
MATIDGRRVTAADIAREVGVSRATVGFVLNATPGQTISEATRRRVLSAAKRLGYRPHVAAQALRSGKSRIILLVLPDWPIEYSMNRHLEEASMVLDDAGYSLVTMTPHRGGRSRPLWETLQPDVVIGMLPFSRERYDEISGSGVPVVTPGPEAGDADLDRALFGQGPALQVQHLVERGRSRLAFAAEADPRLASLVSSRRRVADRAAAEAGIAPIACEDVDERNALDVVAKWRERGVDGVVAYNDDIAAMVVGAALRLGLRVPEDLSVVGHDDAPLSRLFVPAISTIHVDNEGLGRYFASIALSAAQGEPDLGADHEPRVSLVARESS